MSVHQKERAGFRGRTKRERGRGARGIPQGPRWPPCITVVCLPCGPCVSLPRCLSRRGRVAARPGVTCTRGRPDAASTDPRQSRAGAVFSRYASSTPSPGPAVVGAHQCRSSQSLPPPPAPPRACASARRERRPPPSRRATCR